MNWRSYLSCRKSQRLVSWCYWRRWETDWQEATKSTAVVDHTTFQFPVAGLTLLLAPCCNCTIKYHMGWIQIIGLLNIFLSSYSSVKYRFCQYLPCHDTKYRIEILKVFMTRVFGVFRRAVPKLTTVHCAVQIVQSSAIKSINCASLPNFFWLHSQDSTFLPHNSFENAACAWHGTLDVSCALP